eukprot:c21252_g1_i1 orf=137-349(+)
MAASTCLCHLLLPDVSAALSLKSRASPSSSSPPNPRFHLTFTNGAETFPCSSSQNPQIPSLSSTQILQSS